MADKKRKGAAAASEPPAKKTKKITRQEEVSAPAVTSKEPADASHPTKQVRIRKRAADFMNDDDVKTSMIPEEKPTKKSKQTTEPKSILKKGNKSKETNTAAALVSTNDAVDHDSDSELEIATSHASVTNGLQPVGKAYDSDDSDNEDPDQGAALLAGFDSDNEDPAEDKDLDTTKVARIPDHKKTSKKLQAAAQKGSDRPGTVYVGRIPHGFYEKQMRDYFSQFGDITRLRLSRNRRTGASKHFAFIEFESDEVAKIVAETMDNYLMFGHILKCKHAPAENLHPEVWKGANKKFRKIPYQKLERQQLEAPKTAKQWADKNKKEQAKRNKRAAQLKELGYEYEMPELKDPYQVLEQQKKDAEARAAAEPQHAIDDTPAADDKSTTKKSKKSRKADATNVSPLTEGNLDIQNVENAVVLGKSQPKKSAAPSSTTPVLLSTDAAKTAEPSTTSSKKSRKKSKSDNTNASTTTTGATGTNGTTGTDKGDYDNLSSIPLGFDAADSILGSVPVALPGQSFLHQDITTEPGVADSELKKRKLERKSQGQSQSKSKKQKASGGNKEPDTTAKTEEQVANVTDAKKKKRSKAAK